MRRSPDYNFRILKRSKLIAHYEVLRDISEPVEKKRVIYIRAELSDGTIIDIHEVWLRAKRVLYGYNWRKGTHEGIIRWNSVEHAPAMKIPRFHIHTAEGPTERTPEVWLDDVLKVIRSKKASSTEH